MRDKVVLITGASSGIGAGTAVHFASRGCHLSLTGRNEAGLQDTYRKCLQAGARPDLVLTISADLEKDQDINRVLDLTINKFSRLDVLVNNAGLSCMGSISNTNMEDFDRVMKVNVRSTFLLTQLCIPHLIQSKGNVVNVSSCFSTMPTHALFVYSMSKAAVDHMTKMAAKELGPKQVRVNAVNPGFVPTKMTADIPVELAKKQNVVNRVGTAEEVARAIAFLADDEQASFVTGELLQVDGGCRFKGMQD